MKQVPPPSIDKSWQKMKKLSPAAGAKLMEQMAREQPVVLVLPGQR